MDPEHDPVYEDDREVEEPTTEDLLRVLWLLYTTVELFGITLFGNITSSHPINHVLSRFVNQEMADRFSGEAQQQLVECGFLTQEQLDTFRANAELERAAVAASTEEEPEEPEEPHGESGVQEFLVPGEERNL